MSKLKTAIMSFADDPELFDMLNKYRILTGWTWKRFFLVGIAGTISKNGNNPELVLKIAEHLEGKR